jgi:diguanylate cyclase (GGDEF)-like protein
LDIGDFKRYNDTSGHLEGGRVLAGVGQMIKESIRKIDAALRYRGEAFIVILPETVGGDTIKIAERIRRCVKAEAFIEAHAVKDD